MSDFGKYDAMVPRDYIANLKFRQELIKMAQDDKAAREEFWIMCARDPLFYINSFVWTYDPRKDPGVIPFISYGFQDDSLRELFEIVGKKDAVIEKSRDMGASWVFLLIADHLFKFSEAQSILLGSRTQDYVDKKGNPKTLMWKLDFINKNLPSWLRPNIDRTLLHMVNLDNGSVIDGESTTGEFARGDRRTFVLLDEFAAVDISDGYKVLASTRDVTNCRFFNSTPKGASGAYFDMTQREDILKTRMHWTQHPEKAAGLYTSIRGKKRILDDKFPFTSDYPFILDGKQRSPWYDEQCRRCANETEVAQELDINYGASNYMYFDAKTINEIVSETVRAPYMRGDLEYIVDAKIDSRPNGFVESSQNGTMLLWTALDEKRNPPKKRYCVGADISLGTGASNSTLTIADENGEKVAEFASPNMDPTKFADLTVAVCRWFADEEGSPAFLNFEANGPGRQFAIQILNGSFRNLYYRTDEDGTNRKKSDKPGWYSTQDTKKSLLSEYRRAVSNREFVNRSGPALQECKEYIHTQSGSVEHQKSLSTLDPTGARDNHGDRVIADALCWWVLRRRIKGKSLEEQKPVVAPGTFAYRRQLHADKSKRSKYII